MIQMGHPGSKICRSTNHPGKLMGRAGADLQQGPPSWAFCCFPGQPKASPVTYALIFHSFKDAFQHWGHQTALKQEQLTLDRTAPLGYNPVSLGGDSCEEEAAEQPSGSQWERHPKAEAAQDQVSMFILLPSQISSCLGNSLVTAKDQAQGEWFQTVFIRQPSQLSNWYLLVPGVAAVDRICCILDLTLPSRQ